MINESSLKYPVADYLTGLEIPLNQIQLESSHPELKKRQIDLITTDRSKTKVERAFEFKISRQNTKYEAEQNRIFNDLMRLYLLRQTHNSAGYFIIAGTQSDFIQFFRSIVTSRPIVNSKDLPMPQGFYTEWFDFKPNYSRTFEVNSAANNEYKKVYDAFLSDYKSRKDRVILKLPDKITTKCLAISAISREFPTPYVGGIWQVE